MQKSSIPTGANLKGEDGVLFQTRTLMSSFNRVVGRLNTDQHFQLACMVQSTILALGQVHDALRQANEGNDFPIYDPAYNESQPEIDPMLTVNPRPFKGPRQ